MFDARGPHLAGLLRMALLAGFAALVWIGLGASAASAAPTLVSESPGEIQELVPDAPVSAPPEVTAPVDADPADIASGVTSGVAPVPVSAPVPASPVTQKVPTAPVPASVTTVLVPPTTAVIEAVEPVVAAPAKVLPAEVLPAAGPLTTVVEPVVAPLESVVRQAVDPVGTVGDVIEAVKSAPASALHIEAPAPELNSFADPRVRIPEPPIPAALIAIDVVDAQMPDFDVQASGVALTTAALAETTSDRMPLTERQATMVSRGSANFGGLPGGSAASSSLLSSVSGAQSSAGWLQDASPVYTPALGTVPDSSWLLPASLTSDPGSSPD